MLGRVMSDVATAEAPPHPLIGQLAALHHFRVYVDVGVVVVVLIMTNLLAHFTTPWANVVVVPAAAIGLVLLVRSRGLGWTELGLGRDHWRSGAWYALGAVGSGRDGHRRRRAAPVDAADVHERPLRHHLRRAARVDDHHSAADRDPRGARVPRRAARRAGPGVGIPRGRRGGFAAVRHVAHRHVVRLDQQQRRLHRPVRRRVSSAWSPAS